MMEAYKEGERKERIKPWLDLLIKELKRHCAGDNRLGETILQSMNKLDMGKPYIFNHHKWLREKLELKEQPGPRKKSV